MVIFSTLWLNLCNNSDQTLFSNALTFSRSLGSRWNGKSCLIPILMGMDKVAKNKSTIFLFATLLNWGQLVKRKNLLLLEQITVELNWLEQIRDHEMVS